MDEDAQKKAERIKALLAGYYGTTPEPGAADAGPQKSLSRPSQPVDVMPTLDSPAFDAQRHIAQLLKGAGLERLMVEHRNMAREIKQLDSDMQQLVYENYNKFITATDTIRSMKGNVDGLVPELDNLKGMIDTVAERSTMISEKLQTRQESMEELHRVQMLLKKLQVVFDLPKRMRAALEEDVLDTAVGFYAEAQPLLKKYGHRGTFRQIAQESDVVAKEIAQVLKKRLAERNADTEQCVLLLRQLGEADDTLQDKYLQGRSNRLRRILKEATAVVDLMAGYASSGNEPLPVETIKAALAPDTPTMMGRYHAHYQQQLEAGSPGSWGFSEEGAAPSLRAFVRALDEKVINAVQETVMNVMRFFLPQDMPQDPEAVAAKRRPLVALAREVFVDYFRIVRRALADAVAVFAQRAARVAEAAAPEAQLSTTGPHMEFSNDWGTDTIAQALTTLSADLSMIHSSVPELGLRDRAAALVTGAVKHHVAQCFGALQARVLGTVEVVRSRLGDQPGAGAGGNGGAPTTASGVQVLRRGYACAADVVQLGLASLMQGVRAYEGHSRLLSSWQGAFMDVVQGALQQLFLALMASALEVAGLRYDGSDLLREALKASSASASSAQRPANEGGEGGDDEALGVTSEALTLPPGLPLPGRPGPTDAAKTGLVLLLAKLCTHMEQQSVPWVMEVIAGSFVSRGGGGRGGDMPPAFVPGEVARRLNAASSALLAAYVELHGRQLSLMVRRSAAATNWLHHKEPRGPRPVCDLMMERLGRVEAEVGQLVDEAGGRADDGASGAPAAASSSSRAAMSLDSGAVERNLAKIFGQKVKLFGSQIPFTQAAILSAVIGIGLKSLVECVRLQTLGRAGLQQLQLDCHYLRPLLRRFTGGRPSQVVDSLLDEVVGAGVERAVDPSLLEPAVLDRILANVEATGGL